jgi:hypothetical protein
MVIGLPANSLPGVHVVKTEQDFIAQIRAANTTLDERVKELCKLSVQLREYSRSLKEKSDQINQRFQSCVNLRRAA